MQSSVLPTVSDIHPLTEGSWMYPPRIRGGHCAFPPPPGEATQDSPYCKWASCCHHTIQTLLCHQVELPESHVIHAGCVITSDKSLTCLASL